jgi:hypothetical protein
MYAYTSAVPDVSTSIFNNTKEVGKKDVKSDHEKVTGTVLPINTDLENMIIRKLLKMGSPIL